MRNRCKDPWHLFPLACRVDTYFSPCFSHIPQIIKLLTLERFLVS